LKINEEDGRPLIEREILQYRRGSKGQPWRFIDFSKGKGQAVINEPDQIIDEKELKREDHELKSPDMFLMELSKCLLIWCFYMILNLILCYV
jgi:predicted ATPase